MILPETKRKIKEHALQNPLEECCGFVFDNGKTYHSENSADDRSKRFSVSTYSYIHAAKIGKIYAIYHSHIGANYNFSEFDKLNADNHKFNYLVYSIQSDAFNFYPHNSTTNKYSGVDFKIGEHDCYSLVKNYYANELGFNIIDNGLIDERKDDWLQSKPTIFEDIFELNKEKLARLELSCPKELIKNDILLFNYFKPTGHVVHHLGIYLGDNTFMHHPRRKFSIIEILDDLYFNWVDSVVRIK